MERKIGKAVHRTCIWRENLSNSKNNNINQFVPQNLFSLRWFSGGIIILFQSISINIQHLNLALFCESFVSSYVTKDYNASFIAFSFCFRKQVIIMIIIIISSHLLDASVGHRADPSFLAVNPQVTLVINPVVGLRCYFPSQRDHPLGRYQTLLLGDRDTKV